MSEGFLTPEARDYLAALARGDERDEQLQQIHKLSVEAASGMLEIAAEHYAACRRVDFRRAEEFAGALEKTAAQVARAHRATIGTPP